MNYYEELQKDIRFVEGFNACMNCGICTAICPAAEHYNYSPRSIITTIQQKDTVKIKELLESEMIWYCGECMSCKTRCPRNNTVGLIIMALRALSQKTGLFVQSEKGRQQLFLKRTVGDWILQHGYCLFLKGITTDLYPEQGPVWDWVQENWDALFTKMGATYQKEGTGILRKIPENVLQELHDIFDVTGGLNFYNLIEKFSEDAAKDMSLEFSKSVDCEYISHIYSHNNNTHANNN